MKKTISHTFRHPSPKQLLCLLCLTASSVAHSAPVLEEVMVTAQKRTESMQDVPVSVSALTGDDLMNTGFRDVSDIQAQVPSLIVTSNVSPLNTSFRMRRIGNEGNIPTFEPDTALIIDGAFRSRSGLGLGDLVDVQSVEVLKGPQSTLYGKNAGAGVISVNTAGPDQEFAAMLEGSAGSDGYKSLKGSINGPLSDAISGRFSFAGSRRDELIENLVGDDGDNMSGEALRGQLRVDFTDRLSARLIVGNVSRDMNPMLGDTENSPSQISIIENTDAGQFRVTNNDASDRIVEQDDNIDFVQDSLDGVLTFEYMADGFTSTWITSFEDYTADINQAGAEELPMNIALFNDTQAGKSFSQELRFASDGAADFNWLVGAFYYDNDFIRGDKGRPEFVLEEFIEEYGDAVAEELVNGPVMVPGSVFVTSTAVLGTEGDTGDFYVEQSTKSFGIFTQLGKQLTENLELSGGIRYSYEKKTGSVLQSNNTSPSGCGPTGANLVCTLTPDGNNFKDSDDWSAITGSLSLSYFLNEETMLYGTIARGFKAGGYSLQFGQATDASRPFDDETINNLEFGWKSELWDRRARINGSIFHAEYENFQNASFVSLVFAVNNAEKVVVDGIEVDSVLLLTENLTANVNFAYIIAEYEEYTGGQCYYGRTPTNALGQCDMSGELLPFAPKLTGNIALQWEQPLGEGDLYARLDQRYVGEANYSSELDPRHDESAFGVTNLRLGWRTASFDVAAWVNNASDEVYFAQKAPANVAAAVDRAVGSEIGSFQAFTGAPRTYGVTVRTYF